MPLSSLISINPFRMCFCYYFKCFKNNSNLYVIYGEMVLCFLLMTIKTLQSERLSYNKFLFYSTGNYIQYPVINHNRKEKKRKQENVSHFSNFCPQGVKFLGSKKYLLTKWTKIDVVYIVILGNNYKSYGSNIPQNSIWLFLPYD